MYSAPSRSSPPSTWFQMTSPSSLIRTVLTRRIPVPSRLSPVRMYPPSWHGRITSTLSLELKPKSLTHAVSGGWAETVNANNRMRAIGRRVNRVDVNRWRVIGCLGGFEIWQYTTGEAESLMTTGAVCVPGARDCPSRRFVTAIAGGSWWKILDARGRFPDADQFAAIAIPWPCCRRCRRGPVSVCQHVILNAVKDLQIIRP